MLAGALSHPKASLKQFQTREETAQLKRMWSTVSVTHTHTSDVPPSISSSLGLHQFGACFEEPTEGIL